jgi:catechol 2,3-dioxygenase-like lactoylglutathione lyase family enzyme
MKYLITFLCILSACQTPTPRINHVMLYVSDINRSVEFYTSAFDMEVERVNEMHRFSAEGEEEVLEVNMAFLRFPGQNFVLEISERNSGDTDQISSAFQHIGMEVDNIAEAEKTLLAAGAKPDRPIFQVQANKVVANLGFYIGPDGETIELMQVLEGEF